MKYEKKSKWWNCISDLTIMGQEPPSAAGHLLSHVLHTTYSGELETPLCSITLNVKDKCRNFCIRKFDVFWIPFCWHRHWYHFEDNCDKWPLKTHFGIGSTFGKFLSSSFLSCMLFGYSVCPIWRFVALSHFMWRTCLLQMMLYIK